MPDVMKKDSIAKSCEVHVSAGRCAGTACAAPPAPSPMETDTSTDRYRGWNTQRLANEFIAVQVAPDIGGRIIQYQLGNREILWVNPVLAGKAPSPGGLGPNGEWLNYGGDKLWPAPQGWGNDEEWPGPPDAVLDGAPHALELPEARPGEAVVRLTSRPDSRSGIQFIRSVTVCPGSTRVAFDVTMRNIDTKPRRWGIWSVTQINAVRADGKGFNPELSAYCPINPESRYPEGFAVLFGTGNNPTFTTLRDGHLFQLKYQYQVGKVGLDSHAGWTATVDGSDGTVFVQRFQWEPKSDYPDGASVEFWSSGRGNIRAYNRDITMSDNPRDTPYLIECELLSPFARLNSGEVYNWRYQWCASNIGGNYPIVDCTDEAVISQPLRIKRIEGDIRITAHIGVFRAGFMRVMFLDRKQHVMPGKTCKTVTPFDGVNLDVLEALPETATQVALVLENENGETIAELAQAGTGKA